MEQATDERRISRRRRVDPLARSKKLSGLSLKLEEGVQAIGEAAWRSLADGDPEETSPFLKYGFLASLEAAGVLGKRNGWVPLFLTLYRGKTLVAAAPAYLKTHSQGEFVFDFAFADLAQRSGLQYYPKLLVAVPFTPAGGRRILTLAGEDRPQLLRAMGIALLEVERELGVSSVHVNFAREDEIAALADSGFVERWGTQYHWYRHDASSFDDYLARFNSKKRNMIKREVRSVAEQNITLSRMTGEALLEPKLMDTAFAIYKSTIDKLYWGRQYLNVQFFRELAKSFNDHLELIVARHEGRIIAGAINVASKTRLYGRYWGCLEEKNFLHFNVCFYRGIEECIDRKLDIFEPGAGGEHKLVRGFDPTITRSAHHFADARLHDVLARWMEKERHHLLEEEP